MREKLISTSVLDILVSSFAFVSIIVAVLTYCIAYFAGQGTSSGGYNMIYLTNFIFFITRTLEICKAIINKDRVKRKNKLELKYFKQCWPYVLSFPALPFLPYHLTVLFWFLFSARFLPTFGFTICIYSVLQQLIILMRITTTRNTPDNGGENNDE